MNVKLLAALLLGLVAIACTQQAGTGETIGNTDTAVAQTGNTVVINMTAKNFEFSPSTINVKQGDHVIINVVDSDGNHGIGIADYQVMAKFGPGNSGAKLDFIADKAGTFTFRCIVPCGSGHREMTGTLNVAA